MGELVTIAAPAGQVAAAAPNSVALPASIAGGIMDLMAFAAQAKGDDDTRHQIRLYAEAVLQFDAAVAEAALRHLKWHNPRNPFRPSHQDVFEACEATAKKWSLAIEFYFLSDNDWRSDLGSAPLTPSCVIPDGFVKTTLKAKLHAVDEMKAYRDVDIRDMRRSRIIKIPEECFVDGQRDELLRAIAIEEKRDAENAARRKADEEEWRRKVRAAGSTTQ
jgi:hypothetical protein